MDSLSEAATSIEDNPSERTHHSRNTSSLRPLSWVESIHDDRPTYISQQLPVHQRPRLEPREATVRNNDALIDLANFLRENPVPPPQVKALKSDAAPGITQPDHSGFVKRVFRVASKKTPRPKPTADLYRNSSSGQQLPTTSIRSTERPHSRPSEISHHSEVTATTISSSMSIQSGLSSPQPPQPTPAEEKDIQSYLRELDIALRKKPRPKPLTTLATSNVDLAEEAPEQMGLQNKELAEEDALPEPASRKEPAASTHTTLSTPRSQTFKERRASHLNGPPSPAPQQPLPPVPAFAVPNQSETLDHSEQASETSFSDDASELERDESIVFKENLPSRAQKRTSLSNGVSEPLKPPKGDNIIPKGTNGTASRASKLISGREQRTRARKLKHLHGNFTKKDSEHSSSTPDIIEAPEGAAESSVTQDANHSDADALRETPNGVREATPEPVDVDLSAQEADRATSSTLQEQERNNDLASSSNVSHRQPLTGPLSSHPVRSSSSQSQSIAESRQAAHARETSVSQYGTTVDSDTYHDKTVPGASERSRRKRESVASSQQLHDRIAYLERENKLLEAALMAVLKTGGTLIKCPCGGVGFERAVSNVNGKSSDVNVRDPPRSVPQVLQAANEKPIKGAVSVVETPPLSAGLSTKFPPEGSMAGRNSEDRRWSMTSEDSMNWNLSRSARNSVARSSLSSALALYTQTRAGLLVGDGSSRAHST